jgi:hypothetical protein
VKHLSKRYTLCRLASTGLEAVGEYPDMRTGFSAGQDAVYRDRENAFALYAPSGRRVARFGAARLNGQADGDVDLAGALLELGRA